MDCPRAIFHAVIVAEVLCAAFRAPPGLAQDEIVKKHPVDANGVGALVTSPDGCSGSGTMPRADQGRFGEDEECSTDADCDDGLNCTIDTCGPDLRCVH